MPPNRMSRELICFALVGCTAMLVHFLLVALLLVPAGMAPLLANVLGFLLAFQVSYWGHSRYTFRVGAAAHGKAMARFFAVACLSFALNELLYFLLLRYTALDYRSALLVVLALVAALTFALGKLWAFAATGEA